MKTGISAFYTKEDADYIREAAKERGVTASEFVRRVIFAYLRYADDGYDLEEEFVGLFRKVDF